MPPSAVLASMRNLRRVRRSPQPRPLRRRQLHAGVALPVRPPPWRRLWAVGAQAHQRQSAVGTPASAARQLPTGPPGMQPPARPSSSPGALRVSPPRALRPSRLDAPRLRRQRRLQRLPLRRQWPPPHLRQRLHPLRPEPLLAHRLVGQPQTTPQEAMLPQPAAAPGEAVSGAATAAAASACAAQAQSAVAPAAKLQSAADDAKAPATAVAAGAALPERSPPAASHGTEALPAVEPGSSSLSSHPGEYTLRCR
mmetsp:Transcript_61593/g.178688  ORF Transcript_61593/g.178688 Transcript_61593/m.178688 type:complete len:253 (-) Transcript_61593:509-1267(-)